MGEEHCFEVVTKQRVYYLVAKSDRELTEWMHALSQRTMLHKENELLEKAEAMITQEAYRQCIEDEHRNLESYKRRRKSTYTWAPKRLGSSVDINPGPGAQKSRISSRMHSTPVVNIGSNSQT